MRPFCWFFEEFSAFRKIRILEYGVSTNFRDMLRRQQINERDIPKGVKAKVVRKVVKSVLTHGYEFWNTRGDKVKERKCDS